MGQEDFLSDLLYELFFFSSFFFFFVATELLCIEYPFFSSLFVQHHEDHQQHVPFFISEYPHCSIFPKFIIPSLFTPQKKNNSSSLLSQPSSSSLYASASSFWSDQETENVKSLIKQEEPLEVICEICAETKGTTEMVKNHICDHSYCFDCMTKHVATKIQDTITGVRCPGLDCETVYELEDCQPWLPEDLIDRWDKALCEALFLQVPKFYCPFKDCSVMMVVENEEDEQYGGETQCPACHRMFCPKCKVPWHHGVNCEEYLKLNENERQRDDLLVRKLAKEKKWRRCPKCKFYVEKIKGCLHITCRCKYQFCYVCGEEWSNAHVGCIELDPKAYSSISTFSSLPHPSYVLAIF